MLLPDCDKFTDCIQCIVKCKFYYVILQNASQFCLFDPAIASAPVIELFNDTANCPVPLETTTRSFLLIIFGIPIGIITIIGIGFWIYRNRAQMRNNELFRLLGRQRIMGSRGISRFYELDRETATIEMDLFPSQDPNRLTSEDGTRTEPAILEFND